MQRIVAFLGNRPVQRWCFDALIEWCIIVGVLFVAAAVDHIAGYLFCAWVIGIEQHRLSILFHDAAHHSLSRDRALNRLLGNILGGGYLLGIGCAGYMAFHGAHHSKTGSDQDPELDYKKMTKRWGLPMSRGKIARRFMLEMFGASALEALLLPIVMPKRSIWDYIGPVLVTGGAAITLVMLGHSWVLALWFGGYATSFMATFHARMLAEHMGTSGTLVLKRPHPILRWSLWPHNIWVHDVHHDNPRIPYYKLPEIRKHNGRREVTVRGIIALLESGAGIGSGEILAPDDPRDLATRAAHQ